MRQLAVLGGVAAATYVAWWWRRRQQNLHRSDESIASTAADPARRVHADAPPLPADLSFLSDSAADLATERRVLLEEQLSRNTQFLGADGQARVAGSYVAVVGVGAVGAHTAALLARTGVQRLRLIDPALVTRRSLSSHALAIASDVGRVAKAQATRRELLRSVPHCRIDVIDDQPLTNTSAPTLLEGVDMAVLAFPSAPPGGAPSSACELADAIAACQRLGIRCLPVLYVDAAKPWAREVAHQRLSLLHDVCGCVQARALCARLRTRLPRLPHMPCGALIVVHSGEHAGPSLRLAPGSEAGADLSRPPATADDADHDATGDGDPPPLCARAAVMGGMGHAAAAAVLAELVGTPLPPSGGVYSKSNRDEAHRALLRRERDVFGGSGGGAADSSAGAAGGGASIRASGGASGGEVEVEAVDVWPEDLEYLVMDVWGGRCPLSGAAIGSGGPSLVFTRWDRTRPASVGNLVLLSKDRADAHDKSEGDPRAEVPPPLRRAIEATLERAARERQAWAVSRA